MNEHYSVFKQRIFHIQCDFRNELSLIALPLSGKKVLTAKKTALIIEKYLGQSAKYFYDIITKNLGKSQVTWDQVLKCLNQEFNLSCTILKNKTKKQSVTEAKLLPCPYQKIIQYIKFKQTNTIQWILKPNLNINIAQKSIKCDILSVVLQKQIMFYQIRQDRIVCSFQFRYRNVKQKMLQKQIQKQHKRQQSRDLRENQSLDKMDLKQVSFIEKNRSNSNVIKNSRRNSTKDDANLSNHSKSNGRKRLDSNASSDMSFFKRSATDVGVSDWRKKSMAKKDNSSVRIRTNTTKHIFEHFQNTSLTNSIEIAKKFQQARDNFQPFMIVDKKYLQHEVNIGIQDIKIQNKNFNFQNQLSKMKTTSKDLYKLKRVIQEQQTENFSRKSETVNLNNISKISKSHKKPLLQNYKSVTQNDDQMLQDCSIGITYCSFVQNLLLVSFYNRQIRLYKIKKNLHRLKQELIYQKQNDELAIFVQIYKSIFTNKYQIILCLRKSSSFNTVKIYELSDKIVTNGNSKKQTEQQIKKNDKNQQQEIFNTQTNCVQIFSSKMKFDPIYQSALPLGIIGFNEKGYVSLIETNCLKSHDSNSNCISKAFQKQFHNQQTDRLITFTCCKVHSNLINIYMCCKNGYIYLLQRISQKIKIQKKVMQNKIIDISLIKNYMEILMVSIRGQLAVVNSVNLQIMYYHEAYMTINQDSRLLQLYYDQFILYGDRQIRKIQIEENQSKLITSQKPFKIYNNRIKMKHQSTQKYKINHQSSYMQQQIIKNKDTTIKNDKKRVQNVYAINHSQTVHLLVLIQSGQLLAYNSSIQFIGSYTIQKSLHIKQCEMNNALHYLGILYTTNSIEIINLYNQQVITSVSDQNNKIDNLWRRKLSLPISINTKQKDIQTFGFIVNDTNHQVEFFFTFLSDISLLVYNQKAEIVKNVDLKNAFCYYNNQIQNKQDKSIVNCIHMDKIGQIFIGNKIGQIVILHKNTFTLSRKIKISNSSIIKIQPLSKLSCLRNKKKSQILLILCSNNQIYSYNKQNQNICRVYSQNIQMSPKINSKIIAFSQYLVIYERLQTIDHDLIKKQVHLQQFSYYTQHKFLQIYMIQQLGQKINIKNSINSLSKNMHSIQQLKIYRYTLEQKQKQRKKLNIKINQQQNIINSKENKYNRNYYFLNDDKLTIITKYNNQSTQQKYKTKCNTFILTYDFKQFCYRSNNSKDDEQNGSNKFQPKLIYSSIL